MLVGENTNFELGQTISRGSGHHQGGRSGPPSLVYGNQDIFGLGQTASVDGGYPFLFEFNTSPVTVAFLDVVDNNKEFDRAVTDASGRVALFGKTRKTIGSSMIVKVIDVPAGYMIPAQPSLKVNVPAGAPSFDTSERASFVKQATTTAYRGTHPYADRKFKINIGQMPVVTAYDILQRANAAAKTAESSRKLEDVLNARNLAALAIETAKKEGRSYDASQAILAKMDALAKELTAAPLPPPSAQAAINVIQEEKKAIPWIPILGGVAVLGIGLTAYFFLKPKRAAAV